MRHPSGHSHRWRYRTLMIAIVAVAVFVAYQALADRTTLAPKAATPPPAATPIGDTSTPTVGAGQVQRIEAATQVKQTLTMAAAAIGVAIRGVTTLASGRPVACAVRVSAAGGAPEDGVVGNSDAEGRFEVVVPDTWDALDVAATTTEGTKGATLVADPGANEVTVVLRRIVKLTLRLRCTPSMRASTLGGVNCVARVHAERLPLVNLFQPRIREDVATFDLDGEDEQVLHAEVDCAEANTLTWSCGPEDGQQSGCQQEPIPAIVDTFKSECRLDAGMMMLLTVVDTQGRSLPTIRFTAWTDSNKSLRRLACVSDENGRIVRFVRPGDHGRLELPWLYPDWFDGSDYWGQDTACPTWCAGVATRIVADMSNVLRLRFVDEQGSQVSAFRWCLRNNGSRTQNGRFPSDFGAPATDIAYLYGKSSLPPNSAIFVSVAGATEAYAVVDRDLRAEAGVHTLALVSTAPQPLTIRLTETFPGKVGDYVTLRMETAPEDPVPKSYFINFKRTVWSQEFLVRSVLPGSYALRTNDGTPLPRNVNVTLRPGRAWVIDLK